MQYDNKYVQIAYSCLTNEGKTNFTVLMLMDINSSRGPVKSPQFQSGSLLPPGASDGLYRGLGFNERGMMWKKANGMKKVNEYRYHSWIECEYDCNHITWFVWKEWRTVASVYLSENTMSRVWLHFRTWVYTQTHICRVTPTRKTHRREIRGKAQTKK